MSPSALRGCVMRAVALSLVSARLQSSITAFFIDFQSLTVSFSQENAFEYHLPFINTFKL